MKKTLAALALAGSIALIGSPAVAATYPALPPQAAVSDGTVGPGETFVFRGQGFLAGEGLTITVTPGQAPASNGAGLGRSVVAKIPVFQAPQTLSAVADAQGFSGNASKLTNPSGTNSTILAEASTIW